MLTLFPQFWVSTLHLVFLSFYYYWESVHLYMLINMTFSGISLVKKLWDHPYKKSEENNSKQVFRSSFDLSDLGLLIVV